MKPSTETPPAPAGENLSGQVIHNQQSHTDKTHQFNQAVRDLAYKIAASKTREVHPAGSDVDAAMPVARLQLMARRNQSVIDRLAVFISEKMGQFHAEKAKTDRDVAKLFELQREYGELIEQRDRCIRTLNDADQRFALIIQRANEIKTRLPFYYTGNAGENDEIRTDAIVRSYAHLAACESAKADWPSIRRGIQAELDGWVQKLATFENTNADLFGAS